MRVSDLSIIIPTKNRPEYLFRALSYYSARRCPYQIWVGDSSDVASTPAKTFADLAIRVVRDPALLAVQMTKKILGMVTTPYVAYCGDDDFLPMRGLERSCLSLDGETTAVAVMGKAVVLRPEEAWGYRLPERLEGSPAERVIAQMTDYRPTAFGVHRTVLAMAAHRYVPDSGPVGELDLELLPSCLTVAAGPVHRIDELVLVRTFVKHRTAQLQAKFPTHEDWILRDNATAEHRAFEDHLAAAGLSGEDAKRASLALVHSWLQGYCAKRPRRPNRLREAAKRVPGLLWIYRNQATRRAAGRHWKDIKAIQEDLR
jgi:glycosyltransferase domain-containing protein